MAALLAIAAALSYWLAPGPTAVVQVRWADTLDDNSRTRLEREFELAEARSLGGRSWAYVLEDTSRANLEQLVRHPAAADTHHIDRDRFVATSPMNRSTVPLIVSVGLVLSAILSLAWALMAGDRSLRRELWQRLQRGVPRAAPEAAAFFRIVLGLLTLAIVAIQPVETAYLRDDVAVREAAGIYGTFVRWLAEQPSLVASLHVWLFTSGLLFVAGVATRWSYAAFVAACLTGACIWTLGRGAHAISIFLVAMIALLPSRWGDAWSVDALLRGPVSPPAARARIYGYSLWAPRVLLGLGFAAAAFAKVRGGWEWIGNGSVKYHFLTDYPYAVVDWGLRLSDYPTLAIAASVAAIAVEGLLITAAVSTSLAYRLSIAGAALLLFAGFWLLQGVFWPAWWILLLSFAPFERLGWRRGEAADGSITVPQFAAIAAIVVVQVGVSALRIEARPLLSTYDMYSGTYESMDAYLASRDPSGDPESRLIAGVGASLVELRACEPGDEVTAAVRAAAAGSLTARARLREILEGCAPGIGPISFVRIDGGLPLYDHTARKTVWRKGAVLAGPAPLAGAEQ